jgi:hypothetical protein
VSEPAESFARGGARWCLLAVAGISFWFWIGFAFANHNESYAWIAQFKTMSLHDAVWHTLVGVANWRPLGTAWAWILYHRSHGSIVPVELLNYSLAVAAWAWLAWRTYDRRVFAIAAFLAGGALFPGYIYLFHLHGIFYSPLLVFLALLLGARLGKGTVGLFTVFVMAVVTALFHPFALPLFAAFLIGIWLERRVPFGAMALYVAASAALSAALLHGGRSVPIGPETWSGLTVSYRMDEIHPAAQAVVILFLVATAATTRFAGRWLYAAALAAGAIALVVRGQTALPVWLLACAIKLAREGRWSWVLLLALAAIFPIAYPTGSPTYTVPAILIATATLAFHADSFEAKLARLPEVVPSAAALLVVVLVLAVRAEIEVPVVSRLAEPLLAERERTQQLEAVLRWALASDFRQDAIVLYREARSPNEAQNAVERQHRPPTQQAHLDRYLASVRKGSLSGTDSLVVSFGSEAVPRADLVFMLPGRDAGEARVYKRPSSTFP